MAEILILVQVHVFGYLGLRSFDRPIFPCHEETSNFFFRQT